MDQTSSKRSVDANREKPKKKNVQEKKAKAEITTIISKSAVPDPSLENLLVLGKACSLAKLRSDDSGYNLHECYSETAMNPFSGRNQNFKEIVQGEGLQLVPSNSSFISAKSDLSTAFQKNELEDRMLTQDLEVHSSKRQLGQMFVELNSVATETDESVCDIKKEKTKLKDLEKKITSKEKKIKELNHKLEECSKVSDFTSQENKNLNHKVSLLSRQLQSMFELLAKQKWSSVDSIELAKKKNQASELETLVASLDEEKNILMKKIDAITYDLERKDRELTSKARELVEYKNKSTLEMCKLINQIDCLQRDAKTQSELLDSKIMEVQNSMEEEIVAITLKLEAQYQKDVESAIEKFHRDFERLANLPKTAIEHLLKFCEPDKIDFIMYQKEWNREQELLEEKIANLQIAHKKEITQIKDNYDSKVIFLKTQIEALTSQLKERKNIIDIFESELLTYKSNSSMNLLKASTLGDDIFALKELYSTELFSQKQVHELQLSVFEEKVKALTNEILYHARNEEIQMQELENAKKMALAFREKYEQLVSEWREKVEKDFKPVSDEPDPTPELDAAITQFKDLMDSLQKSERSHEERIKILESKNDDEKLSLLREVDKFKTKLENLKHFQESQTKLDGTIQQLIKSVGTNYTKTVESLLLNHVTEVSLKQMEICASEKRHIKEIDELKNDHEKEVEKLRQRIDRLEAGKKAAESELASMRKTVKPGEVEALKRKIEELTMEFIKSEGMMAIKEETEKALNDRIKELEDVLRTKEEKCRKELEDLTAKYVKAEVLSSTKDELVKELEDKLNQSEELLEKSCKKIDRLTEMCSFVETDENQSCLPCDRGDSKTSERFGEAKEIGDRLKVKLIRILEKIEDSKEEENQMASENNKLKNEILTLSEEIKRKEKMLAEREKEKPKDISELKNQLQVLEAEKDEILQREKLMENEKRKISERNKFLEKNVSALNDRVEALLSEVSDNKHTEETELFSFTLQEVRFLYEEMETKTSTSSMACQVQLSDANDSHFEMLKEENEELLNERNELTTALECLKKERDFLNQEIENLRLEIQAANEKGVSFDSIDISEPGPEIERLNEYIKILNNKLEMMKADNEVLLSDNREKVKQNEHFMSELEEAWNQRYEIEDQLMRVRRENVLLKLRQKRLEDANKKISTLVAERKPSVASWIKIHETVENIVDEVLALKSSSDSGSLSEGSSGFDVRRSNSDMKIMTETLHTQLRHVTAFCSESVTEKETLERELKTVENILQDSESWQQSRRPGSSGSPRKRQFEMQIRQANCSSEKRQALGRNSKNSHFQTLNRLKKKLKEEAQLEEIQFRENLEQEIQELKKEMREPEDSSVELMKVPSGNGDECLKSIEAKYEEEVVELTKEFEREVEKLKEEFGTEKGDPEVGFEEEIEKLKKYFEKKWEDLEKRYVESVQRQKRQISHFPQLSHILEQFHAILQEDKEAEKTGKLENFLRDIINLRDVEVKSLRKKYEEAVALLETKHESEVKKLQGVVLQLKENIMAELRKEARREEEGGDGKDDPTDSVRAEYEARLEEEKKRLCDLLEDSRREHEREILALEEFWTEKLSECETKCAMMKATGGRKGKSRGECETSETEENKVNQPSSGGGEKKIVNYGEIQVLETENYVGPRDSFCVSCLAGRSICGRMELKTDDDKLDVIQQRDATFEEMISSMRSIVTKLLTFIGQYKPELGNASLADADDTLYKSIHLDLERTSSDASAVSNSVLTSMDLSAIFQEIKNNSLLNSSDQVRFELERCLKQLKKDATSLLALSCPPENSGQDLGEIVRRVEKEKNDLEEKVRKVEEMQEEMKKEIDTTKERLSQWERNLEVVSEGYGEEIIEPKQVVSVTDVKEKLRAFLAENCGHSPQDINLLEEICKEGDRLKEEWLKEKCDLQQQIEAADKQLHSLRKFLEEQALEREQEREAFDREIGQLREDLKAKERDNSLQNRTNREGERLSVLMPPADASVEALVGQVKELTVRLADAEKNKGVVEGEFQNAVKKIWSLREVIQDLEVQLAEVSEREIGSKKKLERLEGLLEEQSKVNRGLKEELDACRNQNEVKYSEHIKTLEEELIRLRHVADQVSPESLTHLKTNLRQIEAVLVKKTKDLEQLHVSSANVSCSSPSEDVSIRDHLDATRCSTPDEMSSVVQPRGVDLPMEEIDRVQEKLARHTRAEEVAMKHIQDLKMQLRTHRKALEEVQTERDVLLEKVDAYLKENSGLKVRLEEQRCNAGLLQKQLNANLESQIGRLEVDVEKLNEMCRDKDKQLREMKVILENTTKSLKVREAEALNKSKEENALITTLKTDLANALNENEKLEETLEKTREKLRQTLKMPALIDSMIDEKNAEIDRLEKEVARLSSEKTSGVTSRSYSSEEKQKRKIRFSEPDSFSENISSISVQCPSDLRNCSDSVGDFRNSSFRTRRPVGSSTKLESISSIAPLQLSPRGADSSFNWKTSSPIVRSDSVGSSNSPSKQSPTKSDLARMEEISKLQGEIESKVREISELHLEIDILKRKLVEVNQEAATARSQSKEAKNDVSAMEDEIDKLKNNERSLLMTIETIKKNHAEEVEELQNKLTFERGKVEKVYDEIKALEVKKIEIEEGFLSLKEDYNEKLNGERKTSEALLHRIKALEAKNGESELRVVELEKELENAMKKAENTIQMLSREISDLKGENEKIRSVSRRNAETQVEGEGVCVCQNGLTLDMPKPEKPVEPLRESLNELKAQFDKMAALIGERDFNKKEAFLYAVAVRKLVSVLVRKVEELSKEVDTHMKKVEECSVDDLAVKVQKELVLSAKLDNELLSSIEANGLVSKEATPQPDSLDPVASPYRDVGGGDGRYPAPKPLGNVALSKVAGLYKEVTTKMVELGREREKLEGKISEQQKIIRLLEESLKKEKERILEEKDRCSEDAKIMELLRVNLEKRLRDVRAKEKELKKEKLTRMALEKEIENYKKHGANYWENRKIVELNAALENQKEKLLSMSQLLEEEKKKNQELKLSLEEGRLERMSDKNALRLMESDLGMVREQKDNLKMELLKARKLLHSRNVEIGLLKRKINLQEIDIKALSLSNNLQNPSDTSSVASNPESQFNGDSPTSLLFKMKKLNSCVQRHVRESSGMGETLLYLSQETEQMRDIIRKLEENNEAKLTDETLLPEGEVERKLWILEKGRLILEMDTLRRENEVLKHDLAETCKNLESLKEEISKLSKESKSPRNENGTNLVENGFLQERVSHLTRKYLRTESYRKALTWQKHYLTITLQEYQRSEEEAWRKLGRRRRDGKRKPKPVGRFRVVALAALAIFRMKFIVRRWQRHTINHVFSLLDSNQTSKLKLAPLASVLSIYTEPVDPLAYQTQNIFRQSSSQVLRTPPSRDPGPESFVVDHLETIESRQ